MATEIKVLDHGYVRLFEYMGNDLSIVRNARVSYNTEWRMGEDAGKDEKLIRYLLNNKHTSPFESVVFTFDIKCPIFIARQWHRHRTWSYNEISARYTEVLDDYYIPEPENIGVQSKDNKQARNVNEGLDILTVADIRYKLIQESRAAYLQYGSLLRLGCPRELARSILPLNMYTHFFGTVDLHNLLHFIKLRSHSHAQWEIQQYSNALLELITPIVPVTIAAFKEYCNAD